jgi:hypothetical protein
MNRQLPSPASMYCAMTMYNVQKLNTSNGMYRPRDAVSRWFPTAAAQVQTRVWSSGICGGQSGAGAGFLRV